LASSVISDPALETSWPAPAIVLQAVKNVEALRGDKADESNR
jgi:hypothetical protein